MAGPSPLRPTAICSIRTAVIALTWSGGSGGPAVVAWLRSNPSAEPGSDPDRPAGSDVAGVGDDPVGRSTSAPTPVDRPYTGPDAASASTAACDGASLRSTPAAKRDRFAVPGDQHDLLAAQRPATQLDHQASVADHRQQRRPAGLTGRTRSIPVTPGHQQVGFVVG